MRYLGLMVAGGGGLVYAFFAPAFNVATNDNFGLLAPGVAPLSIYAADFYFAIGFTSFSVVICAPLLTLYCWLLPHLTVYCWLLPLLTVHCWLLQTYVTQTAALFQSVSHSDHPVGKILLKRQVCVDHVRCLFNNMYEHYLCGRRV